MSATPLAALQIDYVQGALEEWADVVAGRTDPRRLLVLRLRVAERSDDLVAPSRRRTRLVEGANGFEVVAE